MTSTWDPRLLRELAPGVLAATMRRFDDFAACEDAVQLALLAAAQQWPGAGVPENPRAWLVHVASRRITDAVRADAARRKREQLVVSLVPADEQLALAADEVASEADDTLELLFGCCHPSLSSGSAIALTLRAVGGLTTLEIARAFLVPESTMAQRISRAKATIKASGVPFGGVRPEDRAARLTSVMHVLYLVFNEGYAASSGAEVHRVELADEAIRLTRMLVRVVPEVCEAAGLLALMLLTDARRDARTGAHGELVPLDEQDRGKWDRGKIAEGVGILAEVLPKGEVGVYQVQAAIAAVHDEAGSAEEVDWGEILGLYEVLRGMMGGPMVELNRVVAVAMVYGAEVGLRELERLEAEGDARLVEGHRLEAVRGHLLERAGDREGASLSFRRAAMRAVSTAERDYLLGKAGG